ncbi:hypothetical protein UYW52_25620, partial [Escherichia coli]|nr:hypothetical protein [Escherichia coli]
STPPPTTLKAVQAANRQAVSAICLPCRGEQTRYTLPPAWIIRRIMADEAQPLPDSALPRVAPLAWKTGTSYGY